MVIDTDRLYKMVMYRLSRYWNRIAYLFIHLGRKMIWDQTKRNVDILDGGYGKVTDEYTEAIMCDR